MRDGDHYSSTARRPSSPRACAPTSSRPRCAPIRKKGAGGISLLLIDGDTPGLARTELKKMGWWCPDTAHLRFDDCRVPVANCRRGEPRLQRYHATTSTPSAVHVGAGLQLCRGLPRRGAGLGAAAQTFGAAAVERQVIRHKLVDMMLRIDARAAWSTNWPGASSTGRRSGPAGGPHLHAEGPGDAGHAVLRRPGGADPRRHGLHARHEGERIYREVKVMMIGGGSEES